MHNVNLPKIFQPFTCENLIRLGKDNDGGYLVNARDVLETKLLLSLGIGTDYSFEKDFHAQNQCDLWAYDGSVSLNSTSAIEFFTNNKNLVKKNVGTNWGDVKFSDLLTTDGVFLKCDIDGGEYGILNDIIKHSHKFTGLAMEFHSCNDQKNYSKLINFIAKINQKLVHIHVNNYFYYKTDNGAVPDILELTFTSGDNIIFVDNYATPHKLDQRNNPQDQEFQIAFV